MTKVLPKISDNAMDLLNKRYFHEGETEWAHLAKRVTTAVADAEETKEKKDLWAKIWYEMFMNLEFISSTPSLVNANIESPGQLSSCFTIDLKDNIESIYQAKGECAKIFQKNGGAGFNISVLRPEGSTVEISKGYSCGPVGFMEEFDLTADVVTRNNIRKGAIKVDLNDWHPDIFKFIHCKDEDGVLQRMNISVSMSDEFMRAVEEDLDWELKFPDYSWSKSTYNSEWDGDINKWEDKGYPVIIYDTIKARKLYEEIMIHAHMTGEPGVSFRDTMDRYNPNPHLGRVDRTNPCSEFCSIPYNSCNLGSINILACVVDGKFDWDKFKVLVGNSVRYLDNMITVNKLPLDKIEEITKGVRSVGLGLMGVADAMYAIGIKYDSEEGLDFVEKLASKMYEYSQETSEELADEKGVYPLYEGSIWHQKGIKIRNSNFLSIAPTGSISFIAGVSGGIEPNFALVYSRRTNEGDIYYVVNPVFEAVLKERGLYSEALLQKVTDNRGSCQGIKEIPKDIQDVFVTSMDISPENHTEFVGRIQKYVDLSISKTVNLPNHATVEDIMDVYMQAWKLGVKGITVYRDGSRKDQTLATSREESEEEEQLSRGDWAPIAEDTEYFKRKIHIGCGKVTLFIGWSPSESRIQEFWVKRSGSGGCERNLENMTIAMSGMMRLGGNIFNIEKAFEGVGSCSSFVGGRAKGKKLSVGNNCGNAVLFEIKKFIKEVSANDPILGLMELAEKEGEPVELIEDLLGESEIEQAQEHFAVSEAEIYKDEAAPASDSICPECGEKIVSEGGCITCKFCGYDKCGVI